jgi:hypothetical protein
MPRSSKHAPVLLAIRIKTRPSFWFIGLFLLSMLILMYFLFSGTSDGAQLFYEIYRTVAKPKVF